MIRARLVVRWVTTCEALVLNVFPSSILCSLFALSLLFSFFIFFISYFFFLVLFVLLLVPLLFFPHLPPPTPLALSVSHSHLSPFLFIIRYAPRWFVISLTHALIHPYFALASNNSHLSYHITLTPPAPINTPTSDSLPALYCQNITYHHVRSYQS